MARPETFAISPAREAMCKRLHHEPGAIRAVKTRTANIPCESRQPWAGRTETQKQRLAYLLK